MRTQWEKELNIMGVDKKRYNIMSYEGFSTLIKSKKEVDNTVREAKKKIKPRFDEIKMELKK